MARAKGRAMRPLRRTQVMPSVSIVLVALSAVLATACNESGGKPHRSLTSAPASITPSIPTAAPAASPSESAKPVQKVELELETVGNTMTYKQTALTVPAGAEVHMTFKNNATAATLPHNFVVVKPGTEAAVAAAGLKMGEAAGYLDLSDRDILANGPFVKPGTSADFTFTAPEQPGKYPYICTVPGHYMMMKGVLTVTP
jgi:azurin